MGGAYRWDQSLGKWTPLNDFSPWNDWATQNMGVETMAVDPTNANRVYMVAGTYNSPVAIFRSSDKGVTWQRYSSPLIPDPNNPNNTIGLIRANGNGNGRNGGERLIVDPNSPNILFYGTRMDGLWKSTDFGASWNRVNSFPVTGDTSGTASQVGIEWTLVDKSSATSGNASQRIYAGVSTTAANKIYVSNDGGTTWNPLAGQPTTSAWFPIRAALTPNGNALYMTYSNNVGPNGATAGNVYKVINPATAPVWTTLSTPALGSGGWSGISLDASNPNHLLISTLDWWGGPDDIFRSLDGGATWTRLFVNSHRDDSSAPYASSLTPHWLGDVEIDPNNPNVAMVTTGYGLYRTSDLTNADTGGTVHWSFFNEGFEQSAVLEITSPPAGAAKVVAVIGDRDGIRSTDFTVSPPEGRLGQNNGMAEGTTDDVDVAWNDSNQLVRLTRVSPYLQYSTDNGLHWSWMPSTGSAGSGSGGGNVAMSADGLFVAYEPGSSGRERYSSRATTSSVWANWVQPLTGANQPADGAKIVADLVSAHTFYAYAGTTVSRSIDGGATWTVMTTTAPSVGNWIRAAIGQSGHLWMSRNGSGLWRTTNGGATWTQVGSGVVTTANAVGVGAAAPGQTYPAIFVAGTVSGQTGYFRSDNQGATWTRINDDAHQFGYITVIQGDPRVYGRLYVGANGRGVQVGDIIPPPTVTSSVFNYLLNQSVQMTFSQPMDAATITASDLSVQLVDAQGNVTGPLLHPNSVTPGSGNSFVFGFTTLLANGNYRATLPIGSVSDSNGAATTAAFSLDYFVLAGDANRDRTVNTADFQIWRNHAGQSPAAFDVGDFNYDNTVNTGDFQIWRNNAGTTVAMVQQLQQAQVVARGAIPTRTPFFATFANTNSFATDQSSVGLLNRDDASVLHAV
jgi:hypothetical protein